MQKVKYGEVDVTREVIGGIRVGAVNTTVFIYKSCWEAVGCC